MEALVQLAQGGGRGRPTEVRKEEKALAGDRTLLDNQPQHDLHVLRQAGPLRGLEEPEVVFGTVGPILGNPESLREDSSAVKSLQRSELFHTESSREVGSQAAQRLRRGDRIREPGVCRDP